MTVSPVDHNNVVDIMDDPELAQAWNEWQAAKAALANMEKLVDELRERFDRLVGDHDTLLADGKQVASYKFDGRFLAKKFTSDLPHLAAQYTSWRPAEFLDEESLAKDHPLLFEQYRARTLRPTKG